MTLCVFISNGFNKFISYQDMFMIKWIFRRNCCCLGDDTVFETSCWNRRSIESLSTRWEWLLKIMYLF